jgi:hypothetical protein
LPDLLRNYLHPFRKRDELPWFNLLSLLFLTVKRASSIQFLITDLHSDFLDEILKHMNKNFFYNMNFDSCLHIICRTCKFILICFNKNGKWNMTLKELFEIECIICHLPLLSETKQFIAKMKKFPLK